MSSVRGLEVHLLGRKTYGYATVTAEAITSVGLGVEPAEPPPSHAVIVGWPTEKDQQKERAQLIAEAATAVLWSSR